MIGLKRFRLADLKFDHSSPLTPIGQVRKKGQPTFYRFMGKDLSFWKSLKANH